MKKVLTLLLLAASFIANAQNYHVVRGYVYNEENTALSGVEIRVKNTGLGTITNQNGQYEIRLENGLNRLIYSYMGYETQSADIVSEKNVIKNIWLVPDVNTFEPVEIKRKKRDISYMVVQRVIDRKDSLRSSYQTTRSSVYIKSVEEKASTKKKKTKDDLPEEADFERFENGNEAQIEDSVKLPNLNLYECQLTRHFKNPNFIKEERTAVKFFGDQQSLFYRSTTEGNFNLYQNLIFIRSLGQNGLVSPFSNTAFISYKFKISDIYYDSLERKIYTIRVIPRKLGNALFKGEIQVYDKYWQLKSARLQVPKTALILYDAFEFNIEYTDPDSIHDIVRQDYNWAIKGSGQKITGNCSVLYTEKEYNVEYPKKYFNAELRVTKEEAYEKDTSFWSEIRPEPLTSDEQVFVRYNDSLKMVRSSAQYLDSIDSIYNRVTPLKLLWLGQGIINRDKKRNIEFSPLISVIDPVAIGGWRVRYFMSYYKKFEDRRSLRISPFLNYGFKNQDFKGNLNVNYLIDPMHRTYLRANVGRYFDFVNPFASFAQIIRRDNFFEKNYLNFGFNTEIINGLYVDLDLGYEQRNSLANFKFAALGDSLYENNDPVSFDDHTALITRIGLSYTPRQLYLKEPHEKIILGSKYPTFGINLSKAWDGALNSSIKFSYAEISVRQNFNIGIFGTSQYRFTMGKFFDTSSLQIMDYRYQRAGDPIFFTPAMFTYQLLDSTFPTFNIFYEGHYVHNFNGFVMNRIPLLKKTNIKTMAGGGFLIAPERKYQYVELFVGANRIFKIGKERLRLGLHYVVAQSNQAGFENMFKVSFEFYNRTKNTWSF